MSKELLGISAIAFMIIGEACIIYGELAAARLAVAVTLDWRDVLLLAGFACFSGLCLLLAYALAIGQPAISGWSRSSPFWFF